MESPSYRGVPLGGMGAGSIELSHDGVFRNITINNNRTTLDRIPESPHSFAAIRLAAPQGAQTRLLQRRRAPIPGASTAVALDPAHYVWRPQYPRADFQLNDPACGASVNWAFYSPLIPYDYEASTLPVMLFELHAANSGATPLDLSIVFNWENLAACTQNRRPQTPAPIVPVQTWRKGDAKVEDGELHAPEAAGLEAGEGKLLELFGLRFDGQTPARANCDGEHFISVLGGPGVDCSYAIWDPANEADARLFWKTLEEQGSLPNAALGESPGAGAICLRTQLAPKERRRITFALTWYCPYFHVNGAAQGNGYTNSFKSAMHVARRCLYHTGYYLTSIRKWQHRFLDSDLPDWFARALINNCAVFSSNSLYSREGQCALFDNAQSPETGTLEHRLITSLGSLLFFPRFEMSELVLAARLDDERQTHRLSRRLGVLSFHEPDYHSSRVSQAELCAIFVLCAYRDVQLTGNRARLKDLFPRMRKLVDAVVFLDKDGDGLPESAPGSHTCDGIPIQGLTSISAGIWVAAIAAMERFALLENDPAAAKTYRDILWVAAVSFERLYWDPAREYYRLYQEIEQAEASPASLASLCHAAQLSGQWYADFLGLGSLFNRAHITQALDSIWKRNRRRSGLAACAWPSELPVPPGLAAIAPLLDTAWPSHTVANYAALLIYRGRERRGLALTEQYLRCLADPRGITCELPFKWYHSLEKRHPESAERHASALAIWYIFAALLGVQLNMVEKTLVLRPNLPGVRRAFKLPMMSPVGFGHLAFEEAGGPIYEARIKVRFESPITIERVLVAVPGDVETIGATCETPLGPVQAGCMLQWREDTQWATITPERPISGVSELQFTLTEVEAEDYPEVPNSW